MSNEIYIETRWGDNNDNCFPLAEPITTSFTYTGSHSVEPDGKTVKESENHSRKSIMM